MVKTFQSSYISVPRFIFAVCRHILNYEKYKVVYNKRRFLQGGLTLSNFFQAVKKFLRNPWEEMSIHLLDGKERSMHLLGGTAQLMTAQYLWGRGEQQPLEGFSILEKLYLSTKISYTQRVYLKKK